MKATVFNIPKLSTEDGPGLRTTIFFKGCPLQCWWCHNPEGIKPEPEVSRNLAKCISCGTCAELTPDLSAEACPTGAYSIIGRQYSLDELMAVSLMDQDFYRHSGGGVTLSGGECLLQHRFLQELIPRLQEAGVKVALDTSGLASSAVFQSVAELVDLVLYDLKLFSEQEHRQYTGQSNRLILENARLLGSMPKPVWVRIPVIPNITDHQGNIEAIGSFIKTYMPNTERIDLLGYNDLCIADYERLGLPYVLTGTPRVTETQMQSLRQILQNSGVKFITCANCERG